MDDKPTLLQKIKRIFVRPVNGDEDLPLLRGEQTVVEPKLAFLRPWAKRDAALANLQTSFTQLTELMSSIERGIERQNDRQDQLVSHLSYLPKVIDLIPETSRVQAETLRSIAQQIESQNVGQRQLANILERIGQTAGDQRKILDALRERMDMLNEHDQVISDNLSGFGAAMQSVSKNSHSSAQILENLRNNIDKRDDELQQIIKSQNTRFMALMGVTLGISLAALAAVILVGYLAISRPAAPAPGSAAPAPVPATTQPATRPN